MTDGHGLGDAALLEATSVIMDTMLTMNVRNRVKREPAAHCYHIAGTVTISGAHQLSVVLYCSSRLATTAAARMLAYGPDEEPEHLEVMDAIGELTNLVGGRIKNALSGETRLSVPAVATGESLSRPQPSRFVISELSLECEGEPLQVLLLSH